MPAAQPNRRLEDVQDLRVMSHPLRVRLYYALQALDAATASRLAESVGQSPALVSYHLRQLRDHGFVEEAPDLVNDRRERWWRPSSNGFRFSLPDEGSPETRAAAVALQRTALANQLERLEAWRDEQSTWGSLWSDAAVSSDTMIRLTPSELEALKDELFSVIGAWRKKAATKSSPNAPAEDGDDAQTEEQVFLILHAFPFRP